jgi:hypothetical protein
MKKYNVNLSAVVTLAVIFVLLAPAAAFAQDEVTVQSTGMGVIVAGDAAKARDDAVKDAQRKSVEQAMGTMISAQSVVENAMLIEDRIYSKTQGYIQSYNIVSEGESSSLPNVYEVTIQATVSAGELKDDLVALGILIGQKGNPRIMAIIDEMNLSDHHYVRDGYNLNTAEQVIQEELRAKGFPFVDQQTAFRNMKASVQQAAMQGDANSAAALGRQAGAEVIITGKAVSKKADVAAPLGGMISIQANVNLRAIRADNADIIGTAAEHAAQVHIDEITGGVLAIQKATRSAVDNLADKIIKTWKQDIASGMRVQVTFYNVRSFADLNDLKFVLQDYVRGIKSIDQRTFENGIAVFDVETTSTGQDIAAALVGRENPTFEFQERSVSTNNVEFNVLKK